MRYALVCVPLLLALGSCQSPPAPPSVDPSLRRPVNAATALEAQTCRSELQNARVLANESDRAARAAGDTAARLSLQLRHGQPPPSPEPARNKVYTVLFAFGSARLPASLQEASQILGDARSAPWVVLSGRTDGGVETAAEARIARERTAAVQAFLIAAGVAPARIRATWQPVGDHAADNRSAQGRALNRRVEIEIYRVQPEAARADREALS
jgi:outer membrane protein OmpA-like peptidoglycan-associated protein